MKREYLKDSDFLKRLDEMPLREQYIKITVLNYEEKPIKEIQGICTQGSISIDGNSSVRRTGSVSVVAKEKNNDLTDIDYIFSINKKIKLEIGIKNQKRYLRKYTDFDIYWFPLGIYYIIDPTITKSVTDCTINLSLRDKMAGLNGDCGGTFDSAVTFHEKYELDSDGQYYIENPTIYQIIQELVSEYGKEQLDKILISDIDLTVRSAVQWASDTPLYKWVTDNNLKSVALSINEETAVQGYSTSGSISLKEYGYGDDIGYEVTDFTYPGELTASPGETITSVLDKIKTTLGNYEYFYDLDGNFVFREIKNYLNTTQAKTELEKLDSYGYIINSSIGKSVYNFKDSSLIVSYQNSPKYTNLKNDFVVWGERKNASGDGISIRYHLAIDHKPTLSNKSYNVFFYKDKDDEVVRPIIPVIFSSLESLKDTYNASNPGIVGGCYGVENEDETFCYLYTWDSDNSIIVPMTQSYDLDNKKRIYYFQCPTVYATTSDMNSHITQVQYSSCYNIETELIYFSIYNDDTDNFSWVAQESATNNNWLFENNGSPSFSSNLEKGAYSKVIATDWRTELLLQDLEARSNGYSVSDYFEELFSEWGKIYDIQNQCYMKSTLDNPSNLDYFLDFIDTNDDFMQISVTNIGKRTMSTNDTAINCIFSSEVPELILNSNNSSESMAVAASMAQELGYEYCNLNSTLLKYVGTGGSKNSAYSAIINLVYQYTGYNNTISISSIPIFYLEPNSRITLNARDLGVIGDYTINSISLPLQAGGTMTLNCTKTIERFL